MDFTQPDELESFSASPSAWNRNQDADQKILPVIHVSEEYSNLMQEISSINHSRSMQLSALEQQPDDQGFQILGKKGSTTQEKQTLEVDSSPKQNIYNFSKKSNIFTPSRRDTKDDHSHTSEQLQRVWEIRVFFFGKPIFKDISYSVHTRVSDLIKKAIEISFKESIAEQNFFHSTDHSDYEMRFPETDKSHNPDLLIDPIEHNRVLSQTLIESLILLPKTGKRDSFSEKRNSFFIEKKSQQNSEAFDFSTKGLIKIYLYNEANLEIASLILPKTQNLEKVFEYLRTHIPINFVLTQTLGNDSFPLSQDFQIVNLNSNRLFVKKKIFLDEPNSNFVKPFKVISTIPKDLSPIPAPIGITEASTYEQFQIIKINRRGSKQARILGIDQMKIYNYDPDYKNSKKEPGILSFFFGNDEITGTKKPYRLIKEILEIQDLEPNLFALVFSDKTITYFSKSIQTKQKILRKLRFLKNTCTTK